MSSISAASGTLCGVELTKSHIEDPYLLLSTQQTTDLLAQYDADHACNFSIFDTEFETKLTDNQEVHVSEPPSCLANTAKCSTCL